MGLIIVSKKEGGDDVRRMKSLLHESKENIAELCDMIDRAEIEMQERTGYRDEYREREHYRYDEPYYERRRY